MAEKPKFCITGGLTVTRTSILLNSHGDIIHPSQVKPRHVPVEPYKAATCKQPETDVGPTRQLQRMKSSTFGHPNPLIPAGMTVSLMSAGAASQQMPDVSEVRPKPVNIVDPIMSSSSLFKGYPMGVDESSGTRRDDEAEASPLDETGQMTSAHVSVQGDSAELAVRYDKQLQINAELKRLLVASLGSDLHTRLERLAEDKIALSYAVGEFSRRQMEDYEDLDRVSIQADMWRSKFLATKLMTDELAKERCALARQCKVTASALHELLHERRLIHSALHASKQFLHKMAEQSGIQQQQQQLNARGGRMAHCQTTTVGLSEDILDSLEVLTQLHQISLQKDKEFDLSSFSSAELTAYQVLHDQKFVVSEAAAAVSGCVMVAAGGSAAAAATAGASPATKALPRFHKFARYDGAMCFGCQKCSGELQIV